MAEASQPRIPYLAAFTLDCPLMLIPVANGGWVVKKRSHMGAGYESEDLGAFTDTMDMLTALNNALVSNG